MNRIKILQQELADTQKSMLAMLDLADKESRNLSEEETATYNELEAKFETSKISLERAQKAADRERTMAGLGKQPIQPEGTAVADDDEPFEAGSVVNNGPRLLKDPNRGFRGFGDFAMSVMQSMTPGSPIESRLGVYAAATGMSQGVGADGGYTVPPTFANTIWDGLNSGTDSLMAYTDNYTVEGESITFNANAETSRATGSRWGGARAYWIAEAGQVTSSNPKFRQVKLEPQEVAALVYVTDKLRRNSGIALDQYITRVATEEIMWLVNDAFVNGDGVGKPRGIVGHAATVSVSKETGQAASTVVKKNIDKMWSRCHARSRNRARWFINQDVEPQLEDLSASVGTGGVPVYLPAGGIADAPNARLKGKPVMPLEYCQTLGTVGDIILADMSAYAVGMRGGVDSAMSIHLRFDYAETAFRFMFAIDGQPWLASALTPANGSNTLSPIITLATRS